MADLLTFNKVSLYENETYGLSDISFTLERGKNYHLIVSNSEKRNTLAGLIEGRFRKESGYIDRKPGLFLQSDRLLLGEKQYLKEVRQYLALSNDLFEFDGRKRSKFGFIEKIKARHIIDYPIYRLKGEDKIKFALLALAFQETGITLISQLLTLNLTKELQLFTDRLIYGSLTSCCLLTSSEQTPKWLDPEASDITTITLSN